MKALRAKLKSENGVTIVMALIFFLICAIIGGIVLTSSYANAGRLATARAERQAHLTIGSAAELLRAEILGSRYEVTRTEETHTRVEGTTAGDVPKPELSPNPKYDYKFTPGTTDSAMEEVLSNAAKAVYDHNKATVESPVAMPGEIEFTIAVTEFDDVSVSLTMDEEYNITAVLSLGEGTDAAYTTTLTIPARSEKMAVEAVSYLKYYTSTETAKDPETGEEVTYTVSEPWYYEITNFEHLTVSWEEAVIVKGGGAG
ncbi:MAG: hypothetical protein LBM18_05755 [Oscillospiraceae bacterium]|jgi:hypothetical protein|nr:hypothetical protein [Oscillospiraceae bacterium]